MGPSVTLMRASAPAAFDRDNPLQRDVGWPRDRQSRRHP